MANRDFKAVLELRSCFDKLLKKLSKKKLVKLGGSGGIIAIDHSGNIATKFNTSGMYRAAMNADGELTLGIYGMD